MVQPVLVLVLVLVVRARDVGHDARQRALPVEDHLQPISHLAERGPAGAMWEQRGWSQGWLQRTLWDNSPSAIG